MKTEFKKTAAVVATAHIILVVVVCLLSAGLSLVQRDIPPASAVSLVPLDAPGRGQPAFEPSNPPAPDIPVDAHSSVTTSRQQEHRHLAIVPTTNRIVRTSMQPVVQQPTAEQIRNELIGGSPSSGQVANVSSDRDYAILHDTYYGPWAPPPKGEVGDRTVTALVIFELDGRVREAKIIAPSGNSTFDTSVAFLLKQVREVPGLSSAVLRKTEGVRIIFKIEE
jgi:hypothetical protein